MTDSINNGDGIFIVNDGGTNTTITYDTSTASGIGSSIKFGGTSKQGKKISPKIYFKFIKSKLNKSETTKLKKRLEKLPKLINAAKELDQRALYETLTDELLFIIRENEAAVVGCEKFVERRLIQKFMHMVETEEGDGKIDFKNLEEFPRTVPSRVHRKIALLKKKGVFDTFHVLYLNYIADKEEIKSNKEKIKEKDPIVFGSFEQKPENMYYITDWIDEYCDLTFESFVESIEDNDIPGEVQSVPDITEEYITRLKEESSRRRNRLRDTRPSNYRDLMQDEDTDAAKQVPGKLGLWARVKSFFNQEVF